MSLHRQYFLALSATVQKKIGSANSLPVSISTLETNGALNGPVRRIRKGGKELVFLVFLITQPEPPVHICVHSLNFGFYFGGRGGGKKKKKNFKTMKSLCKGCGMISISFDFLGHQQKR